MRVSAWVLAGLIALAATGARAADCAMPDMAPGAAIKLATPLDEPTRLGLAWALHLGLDDPKGKDWPRDAVELGAGCKLATIEVGHESVDVMTGVAEGPFAWARMSSGRMAFLALSPSTKEGYALLRNPPTGGEVTLKEKPMLILAVASGQTWRYVTQLYDGAPSLETLKADMIASLAGEQPLTAAYFVDSGAVSLMVPVRSNRNAVVWTPLPPDGPQSHLLSGDGVYLEDVGPDQTRLKPSNFLCAAAFGEFDRLDLMLIDTTERGRDSGCRYRLGESWISVFITRIAGDVREDLSQTVAERIRSAAGGTAIPMTAPAGFASGAWRDEDGLGQAIMLQRRGPWDIEIRASYVAKDAAAMEAAAAAVAAGVARDVAAR